MAHLLIVEDEPSIGWGLAKLAEEMGHAASAAASAEQGLDAARKQRPDLIVLDVRLPGMSGLEAMPRFRQALGPLPIIVITAFGDLNTAVEAVRNGAFDYLLKPFDLAAAQRAIERAVESLARPAESSHHESAPRDAETMVGLSPAIQEVFKRIAVVAPTDACVHLRGESGTGKELAARAIHRYSRRSAGPFVAVNVASLSESLAESELFGHARGAFTGADQPRKGFLEQADGGTIFLDEVADIPLALQVKLLRVLEHGEILPVGGGSLRSDFRLISAPHRNLHQRVAEGSFRHDLYYRLITFEIEIPPLRRRRDDIPELAAYFLDRFSAKTGGTRPVLSDETLAELQRRDWSGNVRELRNAIEHATILARGGLIAPEHLPPPMPSMPEDRPAAGGKAGSHLDALSPEEALAALVRRWAEARLARPAEAADENLHEQFLKLVEPPLLQAAMEQCGRQYSAAARRLGLHRITLRKKLDEFGIG